MARWTGGTLNAHTVVERCFMRAHQALGVRAVTEKAVVLQSLAASRNDASGLRQADSMEMTSSMRTIVDRTFSNACSIKREKILTMGTYATGGAIRIACKAIIFQGGARVFFYTLAMKMPRAMGSKAGGTRCNADTIEKIVTVTTNLAKTFIGWQAAVAASEGPTRNWSRVSHTGSGGGCSHAACSDSSG